MLTSGWNWRLLWHLTILDQALETQFAAYKNILNDNTRLSNDIDIEI